MSARIAPNSTDWLAWVEAEGLVAGWKSIRPSTKVGHRAGCPDVLLYREGTSVAVWVRPGKSALTQAQAAWAYDITGEDGPTPDQQLVLAGDLTGDPANGPAVITVLAHPDAISRELVRGLLAEQP